MKHRTGHARIFRGVLGLAAALPALAFAAVVNEEATLVAALGSQARSGTSVSISGTTAIVGAPGANGGAGEAYVFTRSGAAWTYRATLAAADGQVGDAFGSAVDISAAGADATIAVGAPNRGAGAGTVYVFSGSGATWTQNPNLSTAGINGHLGASVSIEGFVVAAGAPNASLGSRPNTGIAVVFTSKNSGATWTRATLRANGGQERNGAQFGASVAISGNTVAVGAPGFHTGNKQNSGAMFIFATSGAGFTQQARLRPSNTAQFKAGTSVSLQGNVAVAGAVGANSGKGAAYVYTRSGSNWSLTRTLTAADGANGDQFGGSVGVQGGIVVVGAPNAAGTGSASGKAYEYSTSGPLLNTLVATNNAAGDHFGSAVAVDGGRAIVGAPDAASGGGGPANGGAWVFLYQTPSVTTITDPLSGAAASLLNVPYPVSVHVDHDVGGSGVPTGSVTVTDDQGGTCDAVILLDASGNGTCNLTSSAFGTLTITAEYSGDLVFSASSATVQHDVTGHHLVVNPSPPSPVLQGEQVSDLTIEVQDDTNQLIASDNTTNVTLTVDDTCGNTGIAIGTVQVVNGIATFSAIGPHFYTLDEGTLGLHATSDDGTAGADDNLGVIAHDGYYFADGFEDCRL